MTNKKRNMKMWTLRDIGQCAVSLVIAFVRRIWAQLHREEVYGPIIGGVITCSLLALIVVAGCSTYRENMPIEEKVAESIPREELAHCKYHDVNVEWCSGCFAKEHNEHHCDEHPDGYRRYCKKCREIYYSQLMKKQNVNIEMLRYE